MRNPGKNEIRKPIVEGIFYPAEREELVILVEKLIGNKIKGKAPFIVTPHGGYSVTGELIGRAFAESAGREIDRVVILSPVHREEQDKIILPCFTRFRTAAGDLDIEREITDLFRGSDSSIIFDDIPHLEEHSIEDQLPFISVLFPKAKIFPVLLGKTTISLVRKLTSALERAFKDKSDRTLFVVTSNLSLYDKKEKVREETQKNLEFFRKGNWREICEAKRTGEINACGAGVLAAVLAFFGKKLVLKELTLTESEERESEKGKTVAYGALAFEEDE